MEKSALHDMNTYVALLPACLYIVHLFMPPPFFFLSYLSFDVSVHLPSISRPITFLTVSHGPFHSLKLNQFKNIGMPEVMLDSFPPWVHLIVRLRRLLIRLQTWRWSCAQYNVLECINYSLCNKRSLIRSGSRRRWCGSLRGEMSEAYDFSSHSRTTQGLFKPGFIFNDWRAVFPHDIVRNVIRQLVWAIKYVNDLLFLLRFQSDISAWFKAGSAPCNAQSYLCKLFNITRRFYFPSSFEIHNDVLYGIKRLVWSSLTGSGYISHNTVSQSVWFLL